MTVNAFAGIDQGEVTCPTWSHLEPVPGKVYEGAIVYVVGCFGDLTVVDVDFADLASSPWFYDDVHAMICERAQTLHREATGVFRFTGTYQRRAGAPRPLEDGDLYVATTEPCGVFEGASVALALPA